MKRLLCPALPTPHRAVPLPENEAHHALQVFRLGDGDEIEAMDGEGKAVVARLRVRGGQVDLVYVRTIEAVSLPHSRAAIVLELAVLKGPAMEWAVEKAVELGAFALQPITTAHTVVQLDRKGPDAFRERWQKIADQSLKQCGRLNRMDILTPLSLERLLAESPASNEKPRLWADEAGRTEVPSLALIAQGKAGAKEFRLLIGPEGGWSENERILLARSPGVDPVSLGLLTLRAETAAIAGIAILSSIP